jgi:hypothetical protein
MQSFFYFYTFINISCMKQLITFILIMITFTIANAQKIYVTDTESWADIKVYVTDTESWADLVVYVEDTESWATGNKGIWYFTDTESWADKKIYYTDTQSWADLVIYFTDTQSWAGWKNTAKKYLLY